LVRGLADRQNDSERMVLSPHRRFFPKAFESAFGLTETPATYTCL
jgi:hypothetical protein